MGKNRLYLKVLINILFCLIGLVCVFYFLPKLLSFFLPFVIGWIIAMIANPLVRFMERRVKIVRKHSSAIIIVLVILAVFGAIYGVVYFCYVQVRGLLNDIPNMIESGKNTLATTSDRLNRIYVRLPETMQGIVDNLVHEIQDYVTNFKLSENISAISSASNLARNVVDATLMAIIAILSAYFFIAERDNLVDRIKKQCPESIMEKYRIIASNFKTAFGGYFKAQFKIMFILIGIMFISLEIMGIQYSFLIAFGIAFLDFLPVFGTGAVFWPWAVIELIMGNYPKVIMLLITYLICQVVKQVLQPKMVGDSIGISPLATLVFMFIGYKLYGILGIILGVPIGMVIIRFYQLGMFDNMIKGFKMVINDINEFRKY